MEANGVPLVVKVVTTKDKAATAANVKATATSSSSSRVAAAVVSGKCSYKIPFTTYGDMCHNITRRLDSMLGVLVGGLLWSGL